MKPISKYSDLGILLTAIAEGYPVKAEEDRWIVVENPEATPQALAMEGVDPYLVLDTWELFGYDEEGELMTEKLKTIDEWNSLRVYTETENVQSGIACPECGAEMIVPNPNIILTSNPPQKNVCCPKCQYATTVFS